MLLWPAKFISGVFVIILFGMGGWLLQKTGQSSTLAGDIFVWGFGIGLPVVGIGLLTVASWEAYRFNKKYGGGIHLFPMALGGTIAAGFATMIMWETAITVAGLLFLVFLLGILGSWLTANLEKAQRTADAECARSLETIPSDAELSI